MCRIFKKNFFSFFKILFIPLRDSANERAQDQGAADSPLKFEEEDMTHDLSQPKAAK